MLAADRPTLSLAELESHDPHASEHGSERRFLCPLPACTNHQRGAEHRSFALNVESGAWTCHRCGAGGKIAERWEQRSRRERVILDGRRAFGLAEVPAATPKAEASTTWRRRLQMLVPLAGTPGQQYLEGRGIPLSVATVARVAFCPRWEHWTKDGTSWRLTGTDRRVVFPIRNQAGQFVGLQGRAIDSEYHGPDKLTVGERSLGMFLTAGALQARAIAITEAPIDALSLALAGVPAVALCGTTGPAWLAKACAFRRVMIGTDSDEAGDKAAESLSNSLGGFGTRLERWRPLGAKDWNAALCAAGPDRFTFDIRAGLSPEDETDCLRAIWQATRSHVRTMANRAAEIRLTGDIGTSEQMVDRARDLMASIEPTMTRWINLEESLGRDWRTALADDHNI